MLSWAMTAAGCPWERLPAEEKEKDAGVPDSSAAALSV